MFEDQLEKFKGFFESLFPGTVEVLEVEEKSRSMSAIEREMKRWTVEELIMLIGPESNRALAERMDRTGMSVRMKRGHFVQDFLSWAKKRNHSFPPTKKMVEEFLMDEEDIE